jgi:hypothetical protein
MPAQFLRIPARRLFVESPTFTLPLVPGDRALVRTGEVVEAGMPIAEVTFDVEGFEISRLSDGNGSGGGWGGLRGHQAQERRTPPAPGKWWTGGDERRGKTNRRERPHKLSGTLLFEYDGRWTAAAGERHQSFESPVNGLVVQARNSIGIAIKVDGIGVPCAVGGGQPARGTVEVPKLVDGELREAYLDMGKAGQIVVAGGRVSTEALTRARAMSIRGIVAGSVGQAEIRDLAASEARQRAALHSMAPFGVLGLDGHQRRPIASPILAVLTALSGKQVAILTNPPMLVLEVESVSLPELPPDLVRVRSGQLAGREGRWLGSAGIHRFRAGVHLEAANVRLGEDSTPTVVPLTDLERFLV